MSKIKNVILVQMKIFLLPTTPSFVTVLDELGLHPILSSPGCQIVISTVKKVMQRLHLCLEGLGLQLLLIIVQDGVKVRVAS